MTNSKGVLKICDIFTEEHPCRSGISIKLQSNFNEITLRPGCSPVNLLHIFRTPFLKNTSGWLLLQWEFEHALLTKLRKIIVSHYFLSISFKLKNRYPTTVDKISILTWRLLVKSSQNVSFELNSSRLYFLQNISYLLLRL